MWKTSSGDVCFTTAYTGKKQADMVLPLSPKLDLGNNCPKLDVYDVVSSQEDKYILKLNN